MEIKSLILVLADISGYTNFMRQHRTSLIHAELIITDLLESILETADYPLTVSKLEGDAVFLYAEMGDEEPSKVVESVLKQLRAFFKAFHQRETEIISCSVCRCEACNKAGDLRLKVFAHSGEALIKQVRNFEELAGEDVILIHRLLKNSIEGDEYLLLTDSFLQLVEEELEWEARPITETYESLGKVSGKAFFPSGDTAAQQQEVAWTDKLRHLLRLEGYLLGRLVGLIRSRRFSNLPD